MLCLNKIVHSTNLFLHKPHPSSSPLTPHSVLSLLPSLGNDKDKSRGALLFVAALLMLLFLDNDSELNSHTEESHGESPTVHLVYALLDQLGMDCFPSYSLLAPD